MSMALSHNLNFGHSGGLDPPSVASTSPHTNRKHTTNTTSNRSWSQVAAKQVRQVRHSLISPLSEMQSTTQKEKSLIKTSIWRPGHGPNSVFVDMSGRKESVIEFLRLVAQQYPSRVGVLPQKVGNLRFAEIFFNDEDNAVETFLETGLQFADGSIVVPCRSLGPNMDVISVRLSKLPFIKESTLLDGLRKSLSPFGDILDIGIHLEPETKTYMGTGFAVINVPLKEGACRPLTHIIPWKDSEDLSFYAVWKQMPRYCKYCHAEGHTLVDCEKRKTKFSCWTCGASGHMAASCPKDVPQKKPKVQKPVSPPVTFDFSRKTPLPGSKRRRAGSPSRQELTHERDREISISLPSSVPEETAAPVLLSSPSPPAVADSPHSSSLPNFSPLLTQEILFSEKQDVAISLHNTIERDGDSDMNLDSSLLPDQDLELSQIPSLPLPDTQSRELYPPSNSQ